VQGIIMGLSGSVLQAFRPQIIKHYAVSDITGMQNNMSYAIKFTLLALTLMIVPCYLNAEYILHLWLGQVPDYAPEFLKVLLVISLFQTYNTVCNIAIHATGNIKYISIITGTIFLLNPAAIWLLFKYNNSVLWAYYVLGISYILAILLAYKIIKKQISAFSIIPFAIQSLKLYAIIFISWYFTYYVCNFIDAAIWRLLSSIMINAIILSLLSWTFILNKDNKATLISSFNNLVSKIWRNQ
jgi:O-antigen/teichoic acid export membrane protein